MRSRENGRGKDPLVRSELFPLGQLRFTPGVLDSIPPSEFAAAMRRHARGDWGDIHPSDRGLNEKALESGGRLLSRYVATTGTVFWIITEADRSATTALLPEEY